jgi:4-hydroxybenzoate polyprenyltransferase
MKLLDWLFAARPLLHLPIWTVYLISLHYHLELSGESFDWIDLLIMVGISLLYSGAIYLNQVYDYESDRINRKVGFLQNGFVTRRGLLAGAAVAMIIPMAFAPLIGLPTLFIFAQLLVLAYIYSVPPLRLKDRAVSGLAASAYAHGVLVSLAVMPEINIHSAGLLGWDNPVYFFLAVGGTHAVTTVPDRTGDAATGKKTLAVVLGRTGALLTALVLFVLAALVARNSGHALLLYLAAVAAALALGGLLIRYEKAVLVAAKMPLLLLTLIAGYFFPIYLVFVVALLIATRIYYRKRFGIAYPRPA